MESLYGELGVIGMRGCEGFVSQVDAYLREWRRHDSDQEFIKMCIRDRSQSVKGKEEEREFLLSWVDVVDYE